MVEDIEGFHTELDKAVLVRITEREVLEDRKVCVVDARIPHISAFAQTDTADFRDDERTRVNQQPVRPSGRIALEPEARRLSPGAGDALIRVDPRD